MAEQNAESSQQVGRLRAHTPKTVAGFSRFKSVGETDGALPATIKRLFLATAAAVKGYEAVAHRGLAAARPDRRHPRVPGHVQLGL